MSTPSPSLFPVANPGEISSDATASRPLVAVTGATGFVGRHVVDALSDAGWRVRLLLRREPGGSAWRRSRPEVVAGGLSDDAALGRLVEGADAVVHLAGLIKAARRDDFFDVNCNAAGRLARTVESVAPSAHFVLVSSLAAREPGLSDYGASKRAGEAAVLDVLGNRTTVLRPPAIYGPHDRETLLFFQIARWRRIPLIGPPEARAAMMHVGDVAALIAATAAEQPQGRVLAMADARPDGYGWREIMETATRAVGNPSPAFFQAPPGLLRAVALVGDVARLAGSASMLNSQKLRELRHVDWAVARDDVAAPRGWSPRYGLDQGFADAVAWYRRAGWLPAA
ncbi:NAD(P)-dependent oxidoreductase [Xylophilus sp. GOD-11R]|uniref:NAD-dependent epimerase/dehydratase family protein n=1 Tax=Xylophilus sp. GOD-11R TaxID=3089814 RepID=UPI00298C8A43|nr:NAD(P)-dependent oxidoreductase [Xylophilus sp. GOD-11R]WPB58970.1 NAD(P)-dependent oxidoreductase [Xylophilus sp. GOD-11R]